MNLKKVFSLLTIVVMTLSLNVSAKTMQFTINDDKALVDEGEIKTYSMETTPYIIDGRTMVPVRIVAETFNADVQWVETKRKVIITLADKVITMFDGENVADVNGTSVALDVASVISNGRMMVPLRFVSETLGFDVSYVDITKQILITDELAVIETNGEKVSTEEYITLYNGLKSYYGNATDEELAATTKFVALRTAVRAAEAKKYGVTISDKEAVLNEIKAVTTLHEGNVLPGVLAALLEKDSLGISAEKFLFQLYLPNEAEAKSYYEENYLSAKHILILHSDTAEKEIKNIKIKLNQGGNFDDLMNKYSEDPGLRGNPGGYTFGPGEFHSAFEEATRKLPVGKVSNVIETSDGYHIIKRIALEEYKESYYEPVAMSYAYTALEEHLTDAIENGEITYNYNDKELSKFVK